MPRALYYCLAIVAAFQLPAAAAPVEDLPIPPSVMALADRLVVLNYGRVIATGQPREVVKQPEVMIAYLGNSHA